MSCAKGRKELINQAQGVGWSVLFPNGTNVTILKLIFFLPRSEIEVKKPAYAIDCVI